MSREKPWVKGTVDPYITASEIKTSTLCTMTYFGQWICYCFVLGGNTSLLSKFARMQTATAEISSWKSYCVSLPIRVSRLQKYQCLRLQEGTLDRMGNSQRSDYNRNSDSPAVKVSHLFLLFLFWQYCPSTALEPSQMFWVHRGEKRKLMSVISFNSRPVQIGNTHQQSQVICISSNIFRES